MHFNETNMSNYKFFGARQLKFEVAEPSLERADIKQIQLNQQSAEGSLLDAHEPIDGVQVVTKVSPLKSPPTHDHQVRDIHTAKLHSAVEKSQVSSEQNSPTKHNELEISQNTFSHPTSKRYKPNDLKMKQSVKFDIAETVNPMMATTDDIITQLIMTEDQSLLSSVTTPFTAKRFSNAVNGLPIIAGPDDHFHTLFTPQQMIHNQMRSSG